MNRQFDLKLAKQGYPVKTKDGLVARIIDWEYKPNNNFRSGLAVKIKTDFNTEEIRYVTTEGKCLSDPSNDLVIFPRKIKKWQNIYMYDDGSFGTGYFYDSIEECKNGIRETTGKYVTSIEIEFDY